MNKDERYMELCFDLANKAVENGNEPFGAVLVKDDEVVMTSENKIHSNFDPTHHAELALIREFCQKHEVMDLSDYTLYTSCEPCFMCSGSMVWANLGRLVYSAGSRDLNEIIGDPLFDSSEVVFGLSHTKPIVKKYVLREKGIELLEKYFG